MRSIHKFQINDIADTIELKTHSVITYLTVERQYDIPCIWAVVDTDSKIKTTKIFIRGTGHPMNGNEGQYIGTLQFSGGGLVFHFFGEMLT